MFSALALSVSCGWQSLLFRTSDVDIVSAFTFRFTCVAWCCGGEVTEMVEMVDMVDVVMTFKVVWW